MPTRVNAGLIECLNNAVQKVGLGNLLDKVSLARMDQLLLRLELMEHQSTFESTEELREPCK